MSRPSDCNSDSNVVFCVGDPSAGEEFLAEMRSQGIKTNSIAADPMFADVEAGDFTLLPDSPALKLGVKPIDMSSIGLTPGFPERYRHALGADEG
jgi:hypothetical protein